MSDRLQHPDPDSLNAFIEGVIPEHERVACLAHLAECAQCREVVHLAQAPLAAPVVEKVSAWKRWFAIPILSVAALSGALVLSVGLFHREKPAARAPEMVAKALPPVSGPGTAAPPPPATPSPEKRRRTAAFPAPTVLPPSQPAPAPPVLLPPPPEPRQAPFEVNGAISSPLTGQAVITGTITDQSGAAVPRAAVVVRATSGNDIHKANTDATGQFNVAGLQPGQYDVQVTAPGFQPSKKQIEVQPEQVARADSTLSVGMVADTVNVTATAPAVNTEMAAMARAVKPLPNRLPAETTVALGKLMLSADSAGTLFLSQNAGKSWKAVKRVWQGKIAGLTTAGAVFQLTTDQGSVWQSRDGSRWSQLPAQR